MEAAIFVRSTTSPPELSRSSSPITLSKREQEVLQWAAEGKSEWEIGFILGLSEHTAEKFIRSMSEGHCQEELARWEKDYRKKYAAFICDSEAKHPLVSWDVAEWEDTPPLRILRYRGKRLTAPGQRDTYLELLSVTLETRDGGWRVTKYDAIY